MRDLDKRQTSELLFFKKTKRHNLLTFLRASQVLALPKSLHRLDGGDQLLSRTDAETVSGKTEAITFPKRLSRALRAH